MRIKIRAVANPGIYELERIMLDVLDDGEIGDYVLLQSIYTQNKHVSSKIRTAFWFPDKAVEAGDVVVLYTGRGKVHDRNEGSHHIHFFYWNLSEAIWIHENDAVVLLHVNEWQHKSGIDN